jgi:hypothetical protein
MYGGRTRPLLNAAAVVTLSERCNSSTPQVGDEILTGICRFAKNFFDAWHRWAPPKLKKLISHPRIYSNIVTQCQELPADCLQEVDQH